MSVFARAIAILALSTTAAGCQSMEPSTPAVLREADADTMMRVKTALAAAMGVADVTLGAGDPTRDPYLIVLPPRPGPMETRSLAAPTRFDIVLRGKACSIVRTDTGEERPLVGVACVPAR